MIKIIRPHSFLPILLLAWGLQPLSANPDLTPLAVMGLEPKGVSQQEADILAERLRSALVRDGRYQVVERTQMETILAEQGFQQSGCVSSECVIQAGLILGVELMVGGSVGKSGNSYAIDIRLFNIETAEISYAVTRDYRGAIAGLLTVISEIAVELADQSSGTEASPVKNIAVPVTEVSQTNIAYNSRDWTPLQFAFSYPQQVLPAYFKVFGIRLNLIHGLNHSVYGVDVGLLNEIEYDLMGLQCGLKNTAHNVYGLQYGLLNYTTNLAGAQIGLINNSNKTTGCQIGLINRSKYLTGVQIGLINNNPAGGGLASMPLINIGF